MILIAINIWNPATNSEFVEMRTLESIIRNPTGCRMDQIGLELFNEERRKLGLTEYKLNPETGTYDETSQG